MGPTFVGVTGLVLREGMVFTIEPMLNRGRWNVRTEEDGWTVVTKDGSLSAQFEHTVAVTALGVSVLTLRPDERACSAGPRLEDQEPGTERRISGDWCPEEDSNLRPAV